MNWFAKDEINKYMIPDLTNIVMLYLNSKKCEICSKLNYNYVENYLLNEKKEYYLQIFCNDCINKICR